LVFREFVNHLQFDNSLGKIISMEKSTTPPAPYKKRPQKTDTQNAADEKKERLAAALRANLRRRKAVNLLVISVNEDGKS
jgi:hypothetical protein